MSYTKNEFLKLLEERFNKNKHRHQSIDFSIIKDKLSSSSLSIDTLWKMEETGGEPDVLIYQSEMFYIDFSKETPEARRNLCYDEQARLSRKKFPPETSAEKMALDIGVSLLTEDMYHVLQEIENIDLKTSSWIKTPNELREKGGALFGDKRYNRTFIYHNGADSYYGVRGFRGYLKL